MEKSHTMATRERTVRGRRFSDRFIAGVLRVFSRVHITLYRWTGGIIGERIFGNRMFSPVLSNIYLNKLDHFVETVKQPGRKEKPEWVKQMVARRRKTLVACRKCHEAIHAGTSTASFRRKGTGEPRDAKVSRVVWEGGNEKGL